MSAPIAILAIDPGPESSALARYDPTKIQPFEHAETRKNEELVGWLRTRRSGAFTLVVEMIACYGMPVGREVFETCVWIGRFMEANGNASYVYRRDVKLHLCNSAKAKDANVRQALIDRFGGKATGIGTKKAPGPLYGVHGDEWAALAVAVTYADKKAL